jgi:L-threonylcarbamoyladenylate synthase
MNRIDRSTAVSGPGARERRSLRLSLLCLGLLAASDAGAAAARRTGGPFASVEVLAADGDPTASAARLFDALHALDEAGVDRIVAQPVTEAGLGLAVMDRLRRAAAATMPT